MRRGRSTEASVNPIDVRWEISVEERERMLVTLPLVMSSSSPTLNVDPHASKRRRAEFVEGDAEGASDTDEDGAGGEASGNG